MSNTIIQRTLFAIAAAALITACGGSETGEGGEALKSPTSEVRPHTLGESVLPADAAVVIRIAPEIECPFCEWAEQALSEVAERYDHRVAVRLDKSAGPGLWINDVHVKRAPSMAVFHRLIERELARKR